MLEYSEDRHVALPELHAGASQQSAFEWLDDRIT